MNVIQRKREERFSSDGTKQASLGLLQDDHGTGYTNGRDWVCLECYDRFWRRPDFISGSYSEIT